MTNIPIECLSCGATGEVLRVTAALQCRCGSTDIDLWDGVPKQAASGGTGWDQGRPDQNANWNEYAGPTPGPNPNIDRKNDADDSHVCQICHGTGKTQIGGGGYNESVCRNCHGTGRTVYTTENDTPSLDATVQQGPPLGAGSNGHYSSWTAGNPTTFTATMGGGGGGGTYTFTPSTSTSNVTVVVPGMKGNKRVTAKQSEKIMAMAATIVENNSGLSTQEAFELARRAVVAFPEDAN